jgi:hypothetical protein
LKLKEGNLMDPKEKMKFLRQMGLSTMRIESEEEIKKRKERKDNQVDKSDLKALARIFNVHPNGPKRPQQTLTEFLSAETEERGEP